MTEECKKAGCLKDIPKNTALPPKPPVIDFTAEDIRENIRYSNLDEAFGQLLALCKSYKKHPSNAELCEDIDKLFATHNLIKKQKREGVINNEDFILQKNRIVKSLLELTAKVDIP